ncbi:MAG: V-type ATP synthase subunit K [Lentisphaeria bacterium]|nr:V-type ATP synthase subunit K [Lentisphaeria bacterium]
MLQALAMGAAYTAVGLAAIGSAIGTGIAGSTAIGAWKKCYQQGKEAPFLLLAMVGAPLSQTIYAMIMMIVIKGKLAAAPQNALLYICIGLLGGMAQMLSAIFQGKCAAGGCISYAETGKGFANYLMVIGVVETCAIFSLIFSFMAM